MRDPKHGAAISAHAANLQGTNCVTVRVLKKKNAKPAKGVWVGMYLITDNPWEEKEIDVGKTDKQGSAQYCIPNPAPRMFRLDLYEFTGFEGEVFDTESVMKNGAAVGKSPSGVKSKYTPNPKPGEIVIFGERWWLIDRWLGPWP
ncbi:MAG: hypothetical protein ACRD59_02350 [Candidatus Acidiferrales bacterium]